MGLDGVELLMEIETVFQLSIPDAEAQAMHSPGQVHQYVCRQLQLRGPRCQSMRIFQVARRLLMEAGWARHEVGLDSPIVDSHFPWKELERRIGRRLKKPPASSWLCWLGFLEEKHSLRQLIRAAAPKDWHWTSERIWRAIAAATADAIGIPVELVKPDADFYAELGMS